MNRLEKKSFVFEDNFQVWKLIKPAEAKLLVVELRNPLELSTVFICIDLNNQQVIWDDLAFENAWSISITGMSAKNLFFTEFSDGQIPESKAVFSVSLENMEIGWYLENTVFEAVFQSCVMLKNNEDGVTKNLYINEDTGESIEAENNLINASLTELQFPQQYESETDYFSTVKNFLQQKRGISILKACDYLEWNSYIIIAYYEKSVNNKLNNNIIILDKNGELILEDILGTDLKGIATEAFFITEGKLIYIKDKKEITTINLTRTL